MLAKLYGSCRIVSSQTGRSFLQSLEFLSFLLCGIVVQNLKLKDYTWVMAELKKLQKEAEEDRREKEQGD